MVGEKDGVVIALCNAVGHAQWSRASMAKLNPKFMEGEMPVNQVVQAVGQGQSPYMAKRVNQLDNSFEVFLLRTGVHVLRLLLENKEGETYNHMVSFDAYRGLLAFGCTGDIEDSEQVSWGGIGLLLWVVFAWKATVFVTHSSLNGAN